jgi:hypothetical protein
VLEHDELVRVGVAPDEQEVEDPNRAVARKPGQLVGDAAFEVGPRLEAEADQLYGADLGRWVVPPVSVAFASNPNTSSCLDGSVA